MPICCKMSVALNLEFQKCPLCLCLTNNNSHIAVVVYMCHEMERWAVLDKGAGGYYNRYVCVDRPPAHTFIVVSLMRDKGGNRISLYV